MSVIQTLRDKYATVVVIVVCISLVAFLLMDALVGPKSFMNKNLDVVEVDGQGYEYNAFMEDVKMAEDNYRSQSPDTKIDDDTRSQIKQQVYNQFVQKQILQKEYDALGIGFPSEELRMLTVTKDADPQIQNIPAFQNPATRAFDPNRVINFIQSIKNAPATSQEALMQRQQWMQLEDALQNSSLVRKFSSLVNQGIFIPAWLKEELGNEQNAKSNISYISSPYTSIPDSSIKISTAELQSYLDKHKDLYKVEASRSIKYVDFENKPSAQDSAKVFNSLKDLVPEFDTINNGELPEFIARNSESEYTGRYLPENLIESAHKADLISLKVGEVYGPYIENNEVIYAKKIAQGKEVGSSYTIQQITISDQANTDSVAKSRIDSIYNAVKGGADFTQLSNLYTNGQSPNGGRLEFGPDDKNIPNEFISFVEDHKVGDLGVVKTDFGYHLIKIVNKQGLGTGYEIAYLSAALTPSQETDNSLFAEANKFRGLHSTLDEFDKGVKEEGLNVQTANNFLGTDVKINDLASSKDIIYWAFHAKEGEVSQVFSLPGGYVVAALTGKTEKGTASLESVRPQIESLVRREKKGALLAEKLKGDNLNSLAAQLKDSVKIGRDLNFNQPFLPDAGFEPKVVGAAFNKEWEGGKLSTPVLGEDGVFVLTIDSLSTPKADSSTLTDVTNQAEYQLRQLVNGRLGEVLRDQADIKDRRLEFQGL